MTSTSAICRTSAPAAGITDLASHHVRAAAIPPPVLMRERLHNGRRHTAR